MCAGAAVPRGPRAVRALAHRRSGARAPFEAAHGLRAHLGAVDKEKSLYSDESVDQSLQRATDILALARKG